MDETGERLRQLAATQHGVVSAVQAQAAGASRSWLHHQRNAGSWEAWGGRVLHLVGAPVDDRTRALARVFDAGVGSVLSHRSSLGHWGVPGFRLVPTDCCVLRSGPPRTARAAIAHRVRSLPADDVTVLEGIPLVRPGLALLQISAAEHPGRVERALDNAWSMRLVSYATLQGVLARNARQGRPGVTLFRELVEARGQDYVPTASGLEARFASILERAGLRAMRRQVDLGDELSWIGRVDFADDDLPLVVEINSERFHDAHLDRLLDQQRHERLRASGCTVLVFSDHDVWQRPTHVVAEVRRTRAELRAARRPAS